jgi:hypothetical protein
MLIFAVTVAMLRAGWVALAAVAAVAAVAAAQAQGRWTPRVSLPMARR